MCFGTWNFSSECIRWVHFLRWTTFIFGMEFTNDFVWTLLKSCLVKCWNFISLLDLEYFCIQVIYSFKWVSLLNLTSEAARLSLWQPAALLAARHCARPRNTTKTTTHIGNYPHSYTNKIYQKKRQLYTSLQSNTTNKQETTVISHI